MIFFGVLVTCFLVGGFIVGAFIASKARSRGTLGELGGRGIEGLFLATVAVILLLAIGVFACGLLPKNASGYSAAEEAELVQAEFEYNRCRIWYTGENDRVEQVTALVGDTTVTRKEGTPSSVRIMRTYDNVVGIVKVEADIIVSEEFIFKGEPDAQA